jgi:hydrogenase-4 component B
MNPNQAVCYAVAVLLIGAAASAVTSRSRSACAFFAVVSVTLASILAFWAAVVTFLAPGSAFGDLTLATISGLGATLLIGVDRFSALFLLIISVMAFLATLYSTAYMRIYERQSLLRYYPILLLFFAGIIGLVAVRDWFFFLICWEFMTLCSYFLVIYDKENAINLRAGIKYLIVTHVATIFMIIAAIALWHAATPHSFSFAASKQAIGSLAAARPALLHLLLALWLIGFVTKAGILPFGDWLPDAYPAAPSGATAAFAGTMTNLGIYGLFRVFVDLSSPSQYGSVWGVVIALLGTGSIFVGTLTALSQDDAKRMVSFNAIGQMGYTLLAIGVGIYFLPTRPVLGLLGLMAGIFHLVNGAAYKSLLFLATGSLEYRAGTRDLNHMGALSAVLPATALMAGIGSLSIAGMPPFNGFASKWLIYQVSIIGGIGFPLFVLFGLTAIFISLVTLAAFLKYLGAAFFGLPSTQTLPLQGRRAEVPLTMQFPQAVLALCCIALGLFPLLPLGLIAKAVGPLADALSGVTLAGAVGASPLGLSFAQAGKVVGVWTPIAATAAFVLCVALAHGLSRLAHAPSRIVPVWHCGAEVPDTVGHFNAHGMYEPFRRAFERVYLATGVPRSGYPSALGRAFDLDRWLYGPIVRAGAAVAERFSRSHVGIPQYYLLWQVIGVVIVLAALFALIR